MEKRSGFSAFSGGSAVSVLTAVAVSLTLLSSCDCGPAKPGDTDGGLNPPTPGDDAGIVSVAPPLPLHDDVSFEASVEWLYSGPNAIQLEVDPKAFVAERLSVIRGRVFSSEALPLSGVGVGLLGKKEFGHTLSRADGWFDLAVNGGDTVIVELTKDGLLPVQRTVKTKWNDFHFTADVVMTAVDNVTSSVAFGKGEFQVASGSPQTDSAGSRTTRILVPGNTSASMTSAGGMEAPLSTGTLRVTEFTVGDNGPARMPGALPQMSGYTYASEVSFDEAIAAKATRVTFNQPVLLYVENYLKLKVGTLVPAASYDALTGKWKPGQNGRILKVLSVSNGTAQLDTNGDGNPDDEATLNTLGLTLAERQQLATLYSAGAEVWRTPLIHLSATDCNFPFGPKPGDVPPNNPNPQVAGQSDNSCCTTGSTIEVQNQTLGETFPISGSGASLHYQSNRMPRALKSRDLSIPLSGDTMPGTVKGITVEMEVAGQKQTVSKPPGPNQTLDFTWNGQDGYGRTVKGRQTLKARTGYVYEGQYYEAAKDWSTAWATAVGIPASTNRSDRTITLWQDWAVEVGENTSDIQQFGGLSLSMHHRYSPATGRVSLGTGSETEGKTSPPVIRTVAGIGTFLNTAGPGAYIGDSGPGAVASVQSPSSLAVGSDGSVYIADRRNYRVRRVFPDGRIVTVAGTGEYANCATSPDGTLATKAAMSPTALAFPPDGRLTISEDCHRIRRVLSDGTLQTVAGTGVQGYSGDDGPAREAKLDSPKGIAYGSDGTLYIADSRNNRIRKVSPAAVISTFAGTGSAGFSGDTGSPLSAMLAGPEGVVVLPSGDIVIADTNNYRIRKVSNNFIVTIAGNGTRGAVSGGNALTTSIDFVKGLTQGADGVLYFTSYSAIGKLEANGQVSRVAGGDVNENGEDAKPALQTKLNTPEALAFLPSQGLLVADTGNNRVRLVGMDSVSQPFAGTGETLGIGTNGLAKNAVVTSATAFLSLPDGSYLVAEPCFIRKVERNGFIRPFAGSKTCGTSGDNGMAQNALFQGIRSLGRLPDNSVLVVESESHRIRRISNTGIVTTFAGDGTPGFTGDFGPADKSKLNGPTGVAVDVEGVVYVADSNNNRIRRIGLDNVISTFAGNGTVGSLTDTNKALGDEGPAVNAKLSKPLSVAIDRDGAILIADSGHGRIRKVSTVGTLSTVAGGGATPTSEGKADTLRLSALNSGLVALASGGFIFRLNCSLYQVDAEGISRRLVGAAANSCGYEGDTGPAAQAFLKLGDGDIVTQTPNGTLLVADSGNYRVRAIEFAFGAKEASEIAVPSSNGDVVWVFNANGRHLRTVDALLGTTLLEFKYDAVGLLSSVVDVDKKTLSIGRNAAGNIESITGPYGHKTSIQLDSNGYVSKIVNPLNETVSLTMSNTGLLTQMQDARGFSHVYEYDASGKLTKDSSPEGVSKTLVKTPVSAKQYAVSVTTSEGRLTNYTQEYVGAGESQTITFPDTTTVKRDMPRNGSMKFTSSVGTETSIVEAGDARFGVLAPFPQSTKTKLPSGLTQTVKQSNAVSYLDGAPSQGIESLTETFAINDKLYASTFIQSNRTWTTSTPEGRKFSVQVNREGRPVKRQVPNISDVSYVYNALGQVTQVAQGERKVSFTYNAQGNLETMKDALGRETAYVYNAADRPTQMTLPGGRTIQLGTDAHGNNTSLTPPGKNAHDMEYSGVDLLTKYSTPQASPAAPKNVTGYLYNKDKELTQVLLPSRGKVDAVYEAAKPRPTAVSLPERKVDFAYNAQGQVEKLTQNIGASLSFKYDGELLKEVAWSGSQKGTVGYVYDADFRVASVSVNSSPIAYTYDKDSLLTGAGALTVSRRPDNGFLSGTKLGNVNSTHTQTQYGEMEKTEYEVSGASKYSEARVYDALGRTVQKVETVEGVPSTYSYTYDVEGRLSTVSKDGVQVSSYVYDANGNRTSVTDSAGVKTATYDGEDRIQSFGSASYTFSPLGQLATKTEVANTTRYQFDAAGMLQQVTLPSNQTVEYELDAQGRRVGRKVDGVKKQGWLYDGPLRVIAETDASGTVTSRFVYATQGHSPDYMVKGSSTYRLVKDMLGSVRLVVDAASGNTVQRIDYDAWGKVTANSSPGFQPFGFAGGLLDNDTRLTRFGAREYDADTGRWVSKDPLRFRGGDSNLYAYVGNEPVGRVDPSGLADVFIGLEIDVALLFGTQVGFGLVLDTDHPSESGLFGFGGPAVGLNLGIGAGVGFACREIEGAGYQGDMNGAVVSPVAMWDDRGWNGFGISLGPGLGASAGDTSTGTLSVGDVVSWVRGLFQ